MSPVSEVRAGPKRSLLAQGRSRDTRQAIIKAALELWAERGYGTGIDDTTAEEIAARAGVAKATFYFHFARKDDILLETGWLTARVFYEDALKALIQGGPVLSEARASAPPPRGRSVDEVIDAVTVKLCRRVERVPRLALRRMLRAQSAAAPDTPQTWHDSEHFGFRRGFAVIFLHAQQSGDIPQIVSPERLGAMFEAQLMAAFHDWAHEEEASLLATLRERFAVLLAGARCVSADAVVPKARRTSTEPKARRTSTVPEAHRTSTGPASRTRRSRSGRRPASARHESQTENEFTREE